MERYTACTKYMWKALDSPKFFFANASKAQFRQSFLLLKFFTIRYVAIYMHCFNCLCCIHTLDRSHSVVEFSSSRYIGSESLKGVPVTLLITEGTISAGEQITINIVATSHSPVSAEGMCTLS